MVVSPSKNKGFCSSIFLGVGLASNLPIQAKNRVFANPQCLRSADPDVDVKGDEIEIKAKISRTAPAAPLVPDAQGIADTAGTAIEGF